MKLTSIGNPNSIYKSNTVNSNLNTKNNLSFTSSGAVLDVMANFWRVVDSGGRAAQFTVEDMFGTNLPRMYQGLMAGKQYTDKYNWKAFIQESIREILTGPTMSFFPMLALACCKKAFGPSANIKVENINNLSDIMGEVKKGTKDDVRKEFFTNVVDDALSCTLGEKDAAKNMAQNKEKLTNALISYSDAFDEVQKTKKRGLIGEIFNKGISQALTDRKQIKADKVKAKAQLAQKTTELTGMFEDILKSDKSSYKGVDFETVKYTLKDANKTTKQASMNAGSYFEHAASYIHDYAKKYTAKDGIVDTSKIKEFAGRCSGVRLFTLLNMIILTGIVMMQIPKLYTKGKVNPNAEEIYNEAKKREGGVNNDK